MKVILSYACAGAGHFKAAQAINNYFRKNNPHIDVRLIDVLQYSPCYFRSSYIRGYTFMVKSAHWLWGLAFYITYLKPLRPLTRRINFFINRLNTTGFVKFLISENPDFVISTHFLPSEIAAYLKRKEIIRAKPITVITDFGVHPFWLSDTTDIYVVASGFTKQQLMREGIEENKIKVWGIPIDSKFQAKFDTDVLFNKLSINKDRFTVLLVTGSFGIGPIEEIIDLLYKDIQILVVCAKNKRLFTRLKNKNYPYVKIFGFIDNIEELMAVSDIIVTKPGGLTISEVLAMELPPIFISAIPGQEIENVKILERYGVGLKVDNVKDIKDIVLDYKAHPDKLIQIKENIRRIKKSNALQELYNVICQDSIGAAG